MTYRGTIGYDEPLKVRSDSGTGKRNDCEYENARHRAWREKNREKNREYMREYMRRRRARQQHSP